MLADRPVERSFLDGQEIIPLYLCKDAVPVCSLKKTKPKITQSLLN